MKKLFILSMAMLALQPVFADNVAVTVSANTSTSVLDKPALIEELTIVTTSANTTTLKLYDSANTTTTAVVAAYTKFASYNTNFDVVFTNENGILVTNTFKGLYTGPTSVSATTSSLPALSTIVVPGNSQRTKIVRMQPTRGLTIVSDQALVIEVEYRKVP